MAQKRKRTKPPRTQGSAVGLLLDQALKNEAEKGPNVFDQLKKSNANFSSIRAVESRTFETIERVDSALVLANDTGSFISMDFFRRQSSLLRNQLIEIAEFERILLRDAIRLSDTPLDQEQLKTINHPITDSESADKFNLVF